MAVSLSVPLRGGGYNENEACKLVILSRIDRESGFYDFIFLTHEFYWIFKMSTEFYFEIQYFNFDWKKLQSHFFTVKETLNSDNSNQQRTATLECFLQMLTTMRVRTFVLLQL